MISREDFTFTIGYSGNAAIVDGGLKRRFRGLGPGELAEKGLFKPALCAAVFDGGTDLLEKVLAEFNRRSKTALRTVDELKRVFGVFEVPEGIGKVTQV